MTRELRAYTALAEDSSPWSNTHNRVTSDPGGQSYLFWPLQVPALIANINPHKYIHE